MTTNDSAKTGQEKTRREKHMNSSAHFEINITTEVCRTRKRLAEKALRKMSLSEWPSFIKCLKLFKENVLKQA